MDNEEYKLPEYLSKIVNVIQKSKNYGKGNNIIPMLLKEKECDTIIIGINDNVIYGKDFLEILLDENKKNPDAVIIDKKNNSILFKPEHYGCNILDREKKHLR